jgi:hypothetical protein
MVPVLNIESQWIPIESNSGTAYRYPVQVTPRMKAMYEKPAVYRWLVTSPESKLLAAYFGETDSLARRIGQYISPGKSQQTNLRIKAYFDEKLKEKSTIAMEALQFKPFSIKQVEINEGSLRHSQVREFLESFALLEFQYTNGNEDCLLLNRTQNAAEKSENKTLRHIRKALREMSPEQRREILKQAQS